MTDLRLGIRNVSNSVLLVTGDPGKKMFVDLRYKMCLEPVNRKDQQYVHPVVPFGFCWGFLAGVYQFLLLFCQAADVRNDRSHGNNIVHDRQQE